MLCPTHGSPMRRIPVVQKKRARGYVCDQCAVAWRLEQRRKAMRRPRRG